MEVKINEPVPIWLKEGLSIEEAGQLYGIGKTTLRELIKNNPDLPFIKSVGNKTVISKQQFNEWFQNQSVIK